MVLLHRATALRQLSYRNGIFLFWVELASGHKFTTAFHSPNFDITITKSKICRLPVTFFSLRSLKTDSRTIPHCRTLSCHCNTTRGPCPSLWESSYFASLGLVCLTKVPKDSTSSLWTVVNVCMYVRRCGPCSVSYYDAPSLCFLVCFVYTSAPLHDLPQMLDACWGGPGTCS